MRWSLVTAEKELFSRIV